MSKRILIADDSATMRTLISGFLESQGFAVCALAVDGVDAIEKARESKPDLILLDFAMGRLNGCEASSVLKGFLPKVPIILFTMVDNVLSDSLRSAVGVDVVLSKPDGLEKLVETIRNLLEREPVDPKVIKSSLRNEREVTN